MLLDLGRSARVRRKIEGLDLTKYIKKAKELFGLRDAETEATITDYRHFLYLVYWNRRLECRTKVVPTKRADILWHAHILFTRDYREMCLNIFGRMLDHEPGLEEGTAPFEKACIHTKRVHDFAYKEKKPGFNEQYFSHVVIPKRKRNQRHKDEDAFDYEFDFIDSADSGGSSGGSDGGSGGGSCGGGCGGGCGG
jgi:uncharacterized membrane protein YgcG